VRLDLVAEGYMPGSSAEELLQVSTLWLGRRTLSAELEQVGVILPEDGGRGEGGRGRGGTRRWREGWRLEDQARVDGAGGAALAIG